MSSTTSPLDGSKHGLERFQGSSLLAGDTAPELLASGTEEFPGSVERAMQLRRLNDTQAKINLLPVEILSTIFEFANTSALITRSQEEYGEEPNAPLSLTLILSAVSYHWRQIATSTPQLWQSLEIVVEDREMTRAENGIEMLRLCIDRSGSRIDLILDFAFICDHGSILRSLPFPGTSEVLLDQLEWLVFVESPLAIRNLTLLSIDRIRWAHMAFLLAPLQRLEGLKVDCSEMFLEPVNIDVARFRDSLCSTRLTVLELSDHCHYHLALALVLHCPNLIQCRSRTGACGDTWDHTNDDDRILHHLQWLEWDAIKHDSNLCFATTSVPALRHLKWSHWTSLDRDLPVSRIDAAFHQFLSTATKLIEFDIGIGRPLAAPSSEILQLLPPIIEVTPHSVQKLTLHVTFRQLACVPSPFIYPLMGRPSTQSSLRVPVPSLKALFLVIHELDPGNARREDWVATNLIAFLRQRWQLGLVREFHLGFNFTCKWDDRVYEGLRELVREGLDLKIEIDGKPVQWL